MNMKCPYGCQTEEGGTTVYPWDESTFKCAVCKARWQFILPPEEMLDIEAGNSQINATTWSIDGE